MIVCDLESLQKPCEDATLEEGVKLADQLHFELTRSPIEGVGLAANQIGVLKRVFIIQIPYQGFKLAYSFVNPKILNLEEPVLVKEGCLSFPDQQVETLRYRKCLVKDDFSPNGRTLTGVAAVCAQHENDHLNGKTMFDQQIKNLTDKTPCPCKSGKDFIGCCKKKMRKF